MEIANSARGRLVTALDTISPTGKVALLDYPDHLNAGDHLIWLGALIYLIEHRRAQLAYASSLVDFSDKTLAKSGVDTIFFTGGGNLGDLWPESQLFRERVISQNHDKKVIILPQSIHFKNPDNLKQARSLFNAHPDLTVFARENESFKQARDHFTGCTVKLCPDMAFMLADVVPGASAGSVRGDLYLKRSDKENEGDFEKSLPPGFDIRDWCSYSWAYDGRGKVVDYDQWYWRLPGALFMVREVWQRRLSVPYSMKNRSVWSSSDTARMLERTAYGSRNAFSWGMAFDAVNQIAGARRLVTNRLHAHILAVMLGKKHIFLANAYHKNESFYRTWTEESCAFAQSKSELLQAL